MRERCLMKERIYGRIALCALTLCLGLALMTVNGVAGRGVPSTIVFRGTKYVDCRVNPAYPFAAGRALATLKGKVTEEVGSKMYPWFAAVVGGKTLFAADTKDLIDGYENLLGKNVQITGYAAAGQITFSGSSWRPDQTIDFPEAFFVSEIKGWLNVCGRAVNVDTGAASKALTYFWIEE